MSLKATLSVCTKGVICFTFVLWRLTGYFLILKTFYMFLFGCFSFWAPTCFPEVICLRYGPYIIIYSIFQVLVFSFVMDVAASIAFVFGKYL